MWKSKKFIMLLVTVVVLVVGATTGAVMASTDDGEETQPETRHEEMLNRVCEIYEENTGVAIDPEQLKNALEQARDEMRDKALENRLQTMVDEGRITQEEADQLLEWWQSRPDVELQGLMDGPRKGPIGNRFGGGMMGGRGFHHWDGPPCVPDDSGETGV